MPVSALVGEHMPDGHQQLAGDGDDGLVAAQAGFQAGQLGLPVGMGVGGGLGGFDHGGAQVAAAGLGDRAGAGGLAGVVDAGAQPGVADQVLGVREAGDVADGGQDGQGR